MNGSMAGWSRQQGRRVTPPGGPTRWQAAPALAQTAATATATAPALSPDGGLPRPPSSLSGAHPRTAVVAPFGIAKGSRNGPSAGNKAGYSGPSAGYGGRSAGVSRSGSSASNKSGYSGPSAGLSRSGSSPSAIAAYGGPSAGRTAGHIGSSAGTWHGRPTKSPSRGLVSPEGPPSRIPVSLEGPPPPRPPKPNSLRSAPRSPAGPTPVAGWSGSETTSPDSQPDQGYMGKDEPQLEEGYMVMGEPRLEEGYMAMGESQPDQGYMTMDGPEAEPGYLTMDGGPGLAAVSGQTPAARVVSPLTPNWRAVSPLPTRPAKPAGAVRSPGDRLAAPEPPTGPSHAAAAGSYLKAQPSPPQSPPSPSPPLSPAPSLLSRRLVVGHLSVPDPLGSCSSLSSFGSTTSLQERATGGHSETGPVRYSSKSDPGGQWPWYLHMRRNEAEDLLRGRGDGWFMVRPTTKPGSVATLSVALDGRCRHLPIRRRDDGRLVIGTPKDDELAFDALEQLVEYHRDHPLVVRGVGSTRLTHTP